MPSVKPFKALRYDTEKAGISSVVAPPYDVIPKKMQDELYRKSPYNIVRLILNKISDKDTENNNRYTRSKEFFNLLLDKKILKRDDEDSFYIYTQRYKHGSNTVDQLGFIGLMSLELGTADKVLPHENTLAAPKQDRLKLMRSVRSNLSPIFILHDDKAVTGYLKKFCSSNKPIIDIKWEGVRHIVWKLSDRAVIDQIRKRMDSKKLFIADGHHRYEVAKMYANEVLNGSLPESLKESAKYMMVYFVEADENMLTVLPTHRIIKDMSGLKKEEVLERLKKYFNLYTVTGVKSCMSKLSKLKGGHAFGMYLGKGKYYVLDLKDIAASDEAIKDKPTEWKRLDVSILHLFVFQSVLEISDSDDNIEFVKDAADAVKAVNSGKFKAAFFLNPTKVDEVKERARLGERMPRKSTYFYPKPLSGLVINQH